MNVQPMGMTQDAAYAALREYKQHRDVYDERDWEIERIYRQISKGKTVISVVDAIRKAGLDDFQRPRLAIARADSLTVNCRIDQMHGGSVNFTDRGWKRWTISVPMPGITKWTTAQAQLPRIPPQHRPATKTLKGYHILWEANWTDIPRDPYLLKRIGKDAWVVLAAWDLTDVEVSVLRAHAH